VTAVGPGSVHTSTHSQHHLQQQLQKSLGEKTEVSTTGTSEKKKNIKSPLERACRGRDGGGEHVINSAATMKNKVRKKTDGHHRVKRGAEADRGGVPFPFSACDRRHWAKDGNGGKSKREKNGE